MNFITSRVLSKSITSSPYPAGYQISRFSTSQGSEFLDDAIRMVDQPLAAKTSTAITKNSVIEGFKVSNHAWRKSGLGRGATEELISNVIIGAKNTGSVITEAGTGKFSQNVIKVFNHNGVKVAVDETRKLIMSIRPEKGFKLP